MKKTTRRDALRTIASGTVLIPLASLVPGIARSQDMPKVELDDPQAVALGYIHETENPEQMCLNCQLYTGAEGEEWGPCAIFPGKSVAAKGWCKSWVMKAG